MKSLVGILAITLLFFGQHANASRVKFLEGSVEGPFHAFYLGKDLTGFFKTRACDTCKEIKIPLTADAKAFLDGKEVPLSRFVLSKHKPSALYFNKQEKKLSRIVWFTK